MAILHSDPYPVPDFGFDIDAEIKWYDQLWREQATLPDDQYVGRIITFPMGDGRALYKVISLRPVTLQWIPDPDRWQIDDNRMADLSRTTVKSMIEDSIRLNKIFTKHTTTTDESAPNYLEAGE